MKKQNYKSFEINYDSKIRDVYKTPVGHDIFSKLLLQLGKSEKLIINPVVGNLKIKGLSRLTQNIVGSGFFDAFIKLVNSEQDLPAPTNGKVEEKWWKEAVFYQIYPRTFCDSNGDGIGDLQGIISKLDYLQNLGVNALWLSPVYDSPMDDNGYDIRDYQKILKDFGSMDDFDELLNQVHARGMHLIMDLVINHTSDEHEWFQKALKDKKSKYHDYYIFRKNKNNWTSFFSGSAWNYYEPLNEYALHLFSKKQMDLNWESPQLRSEVISMINWWLDKGIDGFRMDVINCISKQKGLPDGDELIGKMMGLTGIEHYFYGPHLHEYLREINKKAFEPHNAFSVGETPGLGMQMCRLITGEERRELNMVFSFDHLETPGHTRFEDYEYDLNYLRDYMIDWSLNYGNNCWMSLFYNNHDNPRMVSKITKNKTYHTQIKKLLAVMQFTLRGTPFIFQGDEMGLENYEFDSIEQINDVESRNLYVELCKKMSEKQAFDIIRAGTRDHARILLPFKENKCAFENKTDSSDNSIYSVFAQQQADKEIFEVYKTLIQLRKNNKELVYGDFELLNGKKGRFVYKRGNYLIDCNLSNKKQKAFSVTSDYELVFDTLTAGKGDGEKTLNKKHVLEPYQARVYKR
jgi:oligo-1,6-glucosidase